MKTSKDPRHKKRERVVQELFAWGFSKEQKPKVEEVKEIIGSLSDLDNEITKAAPEWPLAQINRIDLSILRLAVFELIIKKDTPHKVVADEAVELGKKFGSESSPAFINGVLGKVIENNQLDKEES